MKEHKIIVTRKEQEINFVNEIYKVCQYLQQEQNDYCLLQVYHTTINKSYFSNKK